ncbi:leucine-rich repeat-containing protein 2 isoform X1 [Polyodon spathula]|uniref:leucine-rich repeat-containing protein 2 isoform X1 n=1 Tax=Polyodon spathula TaxID=7913 RepID=UPI001B7F6F0C|nr:leucine-rich repeat-containing protein 2 isoform X1 [Polyodon spathula]
MGPAIVVYDLSIIQGIWEGQIRKHKKRQRKERERQEKSALAKLNQEWSQRLEHRKRLREKSNQLNLENVAADVKLYHSSEKNLLSDGHTSLVSGIEIDIDEKTFIFELNGEQWKELPDSIKEMTYLRQWHISRTSIQELPKYIELFQDLRVLQLPRNAIKELLAEIGKLRNLKELNLSYNKLSSIPPELGNCENLEKLELTENLDLWELPFELSNLKQLLYLDISANKFSSIPICVLRMSSLQWLDVSNNDLKELPQDIDRLEEVESLFLQKNPMTYLPQVLCNLTKLSVIVVSGERMVKMPTAICSNPSIKFIKLFDNHLEDEKEQTESMKDHDSKKEHEKEFIQAYVESLRDRETVPCYTTKVSLSCQL